MRYTEMQLSDASLDQPEFTGEPRKIVIATSPRSGSFMLCRLMINARLGIPHEYFNPIHCQILGPRFGMPRLAGDIPPRDRDDVFGRYCGKLMSRRTFNGIFAAKVQWWQFRDFLNNTGGARLFRDAYVVHLYREDVLGQAMSYHAARVTGRWGFDDAVTTFPDRNGDPADPKGITKALNDILDEDREWRGFFAKNGIRPLAISYEELCKHPRQYILEIARHAQHEGDLQLGYSERQDKLPHGGASSHAREEIRQAYLAGRGLQQTAKADAAAS